MAIENRETAAYAEYLAAKHNVLDLEVLETMTVEELHVIARSFHDPNKPDLDPEALRESHHDLAHSPSQKASSP